MTEECSFCNKAVEILGTELGFESDKDKVEVLSTALEAFGACFGCGEDRIVCLPLAALSKFNKTL